MNRGTPHAVQQQNNKMEETLASARVDIKSNDEMIPAPLPFAGMSGKADARSIPRLLQHEAYSYNQPSTRHSDAMSCFPEPFNQQIRNCDPSTR